MQALYEFEVSSRASQPLVRINAADTTFKFLLSGHFFWQCSVKQTLDELPVGFLFQYCQRHRHEAFRRYRKPINVNKRLPA